MSWKISRLSTTLIGLLRDPARSNETQVHVEHIRLEMLDLMGLFLSDTSKRPAVWTRVEYADDIQSLWFLRCDVMHMLSEYCGENLARAKIDALTSLFRGHIPKAQFASALRRR